MTTRTARCACGRVEITVEGEPGHVYACHCDFCQRRSGNVFIASATFAEDQVLAITGETRCYNGFEVDGVEPVGIPGGINYRFCAVCGSSIYFDMIYPPIGDRFYTIALGCFVDDVFPPPSTEFSTKFRHQWVAPVPEALQIEDPMGDDAETAWQAADPRGGRPAEKAYVRRNAIPSAPAVDWCELWDFCLTFDLGRRFMVRAWTATPSPRSPSARASRPRRSASTSSRG